VNPSEVKLKPVLKNLEHSSCISRICEKPLKFWNINSIFVASTWFRASRVRPIPEVFDRELLSYGSTRHTGGHGSARLDFSVGFLLIKVLR
jgi:hypothetical protein